MAHSADDRLHQKKPNWSRKFVAFMVTMPLLLGTIWMRILLSAYMAYHGKEMPETSEVTVYMIGIVGILSTVYIGGQAALDAMLGWVKGNSSRSPQVVVMSGRAPVEYPVGTVPDHLREDTFDDDTES